MLLKYATERANTIKIILHTASSAISAIHAAHTVDGIGPKAVYIATRVPGRGKEELHLLQIRPYIVYYTRVQPFVPLPVALAGQSHPTLEYLRLFVHVAAGEGLCGAR